MKQARIVNRFSVRKAHDAQLDMSKKLILQDRLPRKIRFVGGVDVAYIKDRSIGAVAVLDFDSLELVESQTAICKTVFPYKATLLSFREIRPAILCIRKLKIQPDVFLVDGHGFAHPYRCGLASHLGLLIHKSTIGVAKEQLVRNAKKVKTRGNTTFFEHNGQMISAMIITRKGSRPVYVSIGHMVSLETAVKIVKQCTKQSRIPEPIMKAHEIAAQEKTKRSYSINI